ncbi:hypothetical protein GF354_03020 [Candidatus Peregrinibacteria bacterium]|nr:hypothetical protein [Candidatus Peregrinibacteria bacterium]
MNRPKDRNEESGLLPLPKKYQTPAEGLEEISQDEIDDFFGAAETDVFPVVEDESDDVKAQDPKTQDPKTEELPYVEVERLDEDVEGAFSGTFNIHDTDELPVIEEGAFEKVEDEDHEELKSAVLVTLSGDYKAVLDPEEHRVPGQERDGNQSSLGAQEIKDTVPEMQAHIDTYIGFPPDLENEGNDTGNNDPVGPTIKRFSEHLSTFYKKGGNALSSESMSLANMLLYIMDNGEEALERLSETVSEHIDSVSDDQAKLKRLKRFLFMVISSVESTLDSRIRSRHHEYKIVPIEEAREIFGEIDQINTQMKGLKNTLGINKIESILEDLPAPRQTEADLPASKNVMALPRVPRTDEGGSKEELPAIKQDIPTGKPLENVPVGHPIADPNAESSMVIAAAELKERNEKEALANWTNKIKMKLGNEYNGQILCTLKPSEIKKVLRDIIDEFKADDKNTDVEILIQSLKNVKDLMPTIKQEKPFDAAIKSLDSKKPSWIRRNIKALAAAAMLLVGGGIGGKIAYDRYSSDEQKPKKTSEDVLDLPKISELSDKETTDNLAIDKKDGETKVALADNKEENTDFDFTEPVSEPSKSATPAAKPLSEINLNDLVAAYTPNVSKFKFPGITPKKKSAGTPPPEKPKTFKTISIEKGQRLFDIVGDKDSTGLYDDWKIDEKKASNADLKNFDRWNMNIVIAIYNGMDNLYTAEGQSLKIPTWDEMVAIYLSPDYISKHNKIWSNYNLDEDTEYSLFDFDKTPTLNFAQPKQTESPTMNEPLASLDSLGSGTSKSVDLNEPLFDWGSKGIDIDNSLSPKTVSVDAPKPKNPDNPLNLISQNNAEVNSLIPSLGQASPQSVEDEWGAMLDEFKTEEDPLWDLKV